MALLFLFLYVAAYAGWLGEGPPTAREGPSRGRVAGSLVDVQGKPVPGAEILVLECPPFPLSMSCGRCAVPGLSATSGPEGAFEIEVPLESTIAPVFAPCFLLRVAHPHYLAVELPVGSPPRHAGVLRLDPTRLRSAAWVTGTVVDPAGNPVASAQLLRPGEAEALAATRASHASLRARREALGLCARGEGESDAQGRFVLGGLGPGTVKILIAGDALLGGSLELDGLVAGQEKSAGKVVVEPATASIEGMVVDDTGAAVAGATIRFLSEELLWSNAETSCRSDESGRFRLERLRTRAPARLIVAADGHAEESLHDVPLGARDVRAVLPRNATLKFTVFSPSGDALAEETLSMYVDWRRGPGSGTMTSLRSVRRTGSTFEWEVPPGHLNVIVRVPTYESIRASWDVAPGETVDGGTHTLSDQ